MKTPAFEVGVAAAILLAAFAAQAAADPLKLCADPANLPFSSNAPEAVAKDAPGLYVEIGRAVADALGRPLETVWSLSYFGKRNLRTTLLAGQCDLAVGLPADADFMGPRVILTHPILKMGYAIVVPKGQSVGGVDDLKGKRVAVQFASPPQSLLAERNDVTLVTTLDPEEAMRRLESGAADAAFIWGPNAGYVNHTVMHDAYRLVAVDAPQMQWEAAIGVSSKQPALRDQIDAVLSGLAARIRALSDKYALTSASNEAPAARAGVAAVAAQAAAPVQAEAPKGDAAKGHEVFNGTCAHCHGPDAVVADRKINLRRLEEKYGDQMQELFFTTVTNGRPAKGMPSWKDVFSHEDFVDIYAYLKSVQGK